jgi:hypothetical protein
MPTPRTDRLGLAGAAIQRHPFGFIWQREVRQRFIVQAGPPGLLPRRAFGPAAQGSTSFRRGWLEGGASTHAGH